MSAGKAVEFPKYGAFWARLETILYFLWPPAPARQLIWAIWTRGGLDRRYYRRRYRHLNWFYRFFSAHHYAVFGEVAGMSPSPQFSPQLYLQANPDVAAAGVSPLLHWLTLGRRECRLVRPPTVGLTNATPTQAIALKKRSKKAPFAVCLHLHYPEIWDEFQRKLSKISLEFDLYVSLSVDGSDGRNLKSRIHENFPHAEVFFVENRGRDILPFLRLLQAGAFDGYRAVCKLHGKKSPHRRDGNVWRRKLIAGILPRDLDISLERFLSDRDAAVWVADDQVLNVCDWWGDNRPRTLDVFRRIEATQVLDDCPFPAGSMYWIKPFALGMLRSLQLKPQDFEDEAGCLDGTTAHAVERIVGQLVAAAGQRVVETSELSSVASQNVTRPQFVSAFHLPQFHPTPENDRWWGKNYTEWQAARHAKPQFEGHLQPAHPVRAYDPTIPNDLAAQAQMAALAGVDAFCVYFYWFNGKRLLHRPMDLLLSKPDIAFPFYLCWANEPWQRNWDGQSGETLMPQAYLNGFEMRLARDLLPYFRDPRYQRPSGHRPRFLIYRPEDLPDAAQSVRLLRKAWRALGVGPVEIGAVFHGDAAPEGVFDFYVEMPPHGFCRGPGDLHPQTPHGLPTGFSGLVYDYADMAAMSLSPDRLNALPCNTIRGIMPSWDNTARRAAQAHIARGATPAAFRAWLNGLCKGPISQSYRQELFINAWNEWGEKAMLEPDLRFGRLNLDALAEVTRR